MNRHATLYVLSVVLCFVVWSPQILAAVSVSSKPADPNAIISVQTETVEKTLATLNMTFPAVETTTVESFANGSTDATIIVNMTLINGGVCMTMNTTLPSEDQQTQTQTNTQNEGLTTNQNVPNNEATTETSSLWPWVNWTDNIFFLDAGNNGSDIVSYDHPDNYDGRGYYPCEPYLSYALQGAVREHIHIPTNVLAAWISGNISSSDALADILEIGGGFATALGGVGASFGFLSTPVAIAAIIAGLGSMIDGFAKLLGFDNTAAYLKNKVEEQDIKFEDGWMWQWGFEVTQTSDFFIGYPPIFNLVDPIEAPFDYAAQIAYLNEFHSVCIGFESTFQYQQAMGADYNSPQTISTQVWSEAWVPGDFAGPSTRSN